MPGDERRDVEHEVVFATQSDGKRPSLAQQSVPDPDVGVRRTVVARWLVGELELDLV
jgi:hypothetical protein